MSIQSTTMENITKNLGQNQISLTCEICDEEFKTNNGLKKHFNITHKFEKEDPQCNICQKVFKIQSKLTMHINNGAKVTRSTSAYALPIFLPRPKN